MQQDEVLERMLDYFRATGQGEWSEESRPDQENRTEPSPDYIIRNLETDHLAAVEITQFNWPLDETTVIKAIGHCCRKVSQTIGTRVCGLFQISVDLLDVRSAGVFARRQRQTTVQQLTRAIADTAPSMAVGEVRALDLPFEARLTRLGDSGPGMVGWGSNTSTETFEEMDDLEAVMNDNARKFAAFEGMPHILVIVFLSGTVDSVKLIAPVLQLPRAVDRLLFLLPDGGGWEFVEYSEVCRSQLGVVVDRENRRVTWSPVGRHSDR